MKLGLFTAITVVAVLAQAASAEPADSPAVQKARQIRLDVEAKQKELAEEKRAEAPAPASPTAPLALPVDETDSPGATQQ